jgi:hypothetical protein
MIDYRSEMAPKPPVIETKLGGEVLYPLNSTLVRRFRAAAFWPWLVVGISIVNILLSFFRTPIRFTLGFTTTELIYEVGHAIGPIATYVSLVIILAILGAVATCGVYALRSRVWAFWATIAIVGFDTVLFVAATGFASLFGIIFRVGVICTLFYAIKPAKLYTERKLNGQA